MKNFRTIILIWFLLAMVNTICVIFDDEGIFYRLGRMLLRDAGAMLAITSFLLFKEEIRRETRFVFLNYALFFSFIGTICSAFEWIMRWLHLTDD